MIEKISQYFTTVKLSQTPFHLKARKCIHGRIFFALSLTCPAEWHMRYCFNVQYEYIWRGYAYH
jgi:hypothetical protein